MILLIICCVVLAISLYYLVKYKVYYDLITKKFGDVEIKYIEKLLMQLVENLQSDNIQEVIKRLEKLKDRSKYSSLSICGENKDTCWDGYLGGGSCNPDLSNASCFERGYTVDTGRKWNTGYNDIIYKKEN